MNDCRRIIESLRAGIPSRLVGNVLSQTRLDLIDKILQDNNHGMIITGKYGEGKTHLLNTIASLSEKNNKVVTLLPLSKETPFHNLPVIYKKILENTFFPNQIQSNIFMKMESITSESEIAKDLLLFAKTSLETDRLYYVFKAYLSSRNADEHFLLQSDLAGDFLTTSKLKSVFREYCDEKPIFRTTFKKSSHCMDYLKFMSHFFKLLGYEGWVIMFDEAELIGRFGKSSRMKAYTNMNLFLTEQKNFEDVYTLFAFTSSFNEDVIQGKGDLENIKLISDQEPQKKIIKFVINSIINAPELKPLSKQELRDLSDTIIDIYERAFTWKCPISKDEINNKCINIGFLLRTKIRAIIEMLDELFLYKDSEIELSAINPDTEDISSLEDIFTD